MSPIRFKQFAPVMYLGVAVTVYFYRVLMIGVLTPPTDPTGSSTMGDAAFGIAVATWALTAVPTLLVCRQNSALNLAANVLLLATATVVLMTGLFFRLPF